jgi:hypothetical protein
VPDNLNHEEPTMLFATPQEHADNPPSSWAVRKAGRRLWQLCDKQGGVLGSATTKREAESLKGEGFYFNLYNDEGRWFRGERVRDWKPYRGCYKCGRPASVELVMPATATAAEKSLACCPEHGPFGPEEQPQDNPQ